MPISKICVLGGSGFVGSHLVARLSRQGIGCRILTRHPHRHTHLTVNPGVELVSADLFDHQALSKQLTGCDAVINLIGILNESGEKITFRRFHIELVDHIINACRQAGVTRLLHMSALNADEARGSSRYLRSKGEGENRAHTHGGASMAVTSFRPSVIFGPGDSFFNRFASLLKISPVIFPLACPNTKFAPIYAGDVADAFAHALTDTSTRDKHYDLCGPETYTLKELVLYTAKTLNLRRVVFGLGDLGSRLQAQLLGYLPGKPFSLDNYLSLKTDSVCTIDGLSLLGITPQSIQSIVPLYLKSASYRGRFDAYRKQT